MSSSSCLFLVATLWLQTWYGSCRVVDYSRCSSGFYMDPALLRCLPCDHICSLEVNPLMCKEECPGYVPSTTTPRPTTSGVPPKPPTSFPSDADANIGALIIINTAMIVLLILILVVVIIVCKRMLPRNSGYVGNPRHYAEHESDQSLREGLVQVQVCRYTFWKRWKCCRKGDGNNQTIIQDEVTQSTRVMSVCDRHADVSSPRASERWPTEQAGGVSQHYMQEPRSRHGKTGLGHDKYNTKASSQKAIKASENVERSSLFYQGGSPASSGVSDTPLLRKPRTSQEHEQNVALTESIGEGRLEGVPPGQVINFESVTPVSLSNDKLPRLGVQNRDSEEEPSESRNDTTVKSVSNARRFPATSESSPVKPDYFRRSTESSPANSTASDTPLLPAHHQSRNHAYERSLSPELSRQSAGPSIASGRRLAQPVSSSSERPGLVNAQVIVSDRGFSPQNSLGPEEGNWMHSIMEHEAPYDLSSQISSLAKDAQHNERPSQSVMEDYRIWEQRNDHVWGSAMADDNKLDIFVFGVPAEVARDGIQTETRLRPDQYRIVLLEAAPELVSDEAN